MELILEHDSFSRNVDQEITSIAIKEEYNFTFYNGNDIKRGRIIHQWNRSYISFCRLINFTSFLVIRERDSRLTNSFILVEQFFANRFFFLFSEKGSSKKHFVENSLVSRRGGHRGLINFCPSLRSNDRGRLVASSLVWKGGEK